MTMLRSGAILGLVTFLAQGYAATTQVMPPDVVTLHVTFRPRQGDKIPTVYDGTLTASAGEVRRVRPWRPDPRTTIDGTSWKLKTDRALPRNANERRRGYAAMPLRPVSLLVELHGTGPQTRLRFTTTQGDFSLALTDVPYGAKKTFLENLVLVTRVASGTTILQAPTEDDYPSALQGPDGKLYVAYVAFTHGDRFRKRTQLPAAPKELDYLATPPGGDQVVLLRLDGDAWTGPLAVTPTGQDVYRTAIAADGSGRVWVFWSAQQNGNWDIYARALKDDGWSAVIRLTEDQGADSFPAAATDSAGRVWIAWQAFRGSNARILAARQEGDRFGPPMLVADSPANEWTPAIASSRQGHVAVAWDTYATGDYDVYARIWSKGRFGAAIPVAASLRAEMRPSAAYDPAGRLWIAYENAPAKWGKDWGALEKEGVALYQGRSVAVRVWAQEKLWEPAGDPARPFRPGQPRGRPRARRQGVRLAVPRIAAGPDGRVWLAIRSPRLGVRAPVGPTWFEHVAYYTGAGWSGEIVCPVTDNILDNRPALLPRPGGGLLLIGSSDGRNATAGSLPRWLIRQLRSAGERIVEQPRPSPWPDPVNNELVMAAIELPPATGTVQLNPLAAPAPAKPDPAAIRESRDVARARAARVTIDGKELRIMRGEFHRHTELSQDGDGDGLLLDMWRYGMDAASLDWIGNGDHDNGAGREYSWWITQKTTDIFHVAGSFTPLFTYERSCSYPDGHRNVVFARRGIRTLPRLRGGMGKALDDLPEDAARPPTPDTQNLYRYLAHFDGICASHTSGTDMGTDWRDSDRRVEPVVEIYQGCRQSYEMPGAPRSNTAEKSLGGWRPLGFVSRALKKGLRLGFQASSDHTSTHISYCNVWAAAPTRAAILEALKRRHVYGATDNIVAVVTCGDHFMGDAFTLSRKPTISVRLAGTQIFARVHVIKDSTYVHTVEPGTKEVTFQWTDFDARPGATSYYYIRGEQQDGELVWASPMWITYNP